jgi:hypothetical protein
MGAAGEDDRAALIPSLARRLLKSGSACFDRLSMNGKSSIFSIPVSFALSLSKGERGVVKHFRKGRRDVVAGCDNEPNGGAAKNSVKFPLDPSAIVHGRER